MPVLVNARRMWWCLLAVASAVSGASAEATGPQVLHGHVPAAVARLQPAGRLPEQTALRLAIGLPLRNREALDTLLQQIYDPVNPRYRHYLTPKEFTEEFGPTEEDYQALIAFANANGLTVVGTHVNRMILDVAAPAGDVERVFHVTLHVFQHPSESRTFYAPDVEPSVDTGVPILHISGLDNYTLPHPRIHKATVERAMSVAPHSGSGPGGTYMGDDFRAAYAPGVTFTGSGQIVGLLEFDGYYSNDITAYETLSGLPNVPLENVLLDGFNGKPTTGPDSGNSEVALDIEMAVAMAPGLSKVIVYEAGPNGNPDDILSIMTTDNRAKQLSCSWGWGGGADPTADQLLQQMAAQGQSFFDAVGDNDAFVGDTSSQFPSDDPYMTQVGGTTLSTSGAGGSYDSETVWNAGFVQSSGSYYGSGGGISTVYSIPSWQKGFSMSASQGSTTMRNVPDVAIVSDSISIVADKGQEEVIYGTSCGAPLWAGFIALVNEQATAAGKPPVGFINPAIYAIGQGSGYASCLHDITSGNNEWSSSPNKFSAVTGYDLCTGWGTPTGSNLINALAGTAPVNLSFISAPVVTNALLQVGGLAVVEADETNTFLANAVDQDGNPLKYRWSFGDGTFSNWLVTNTVNHAYAADCGTYSVSVTVSNGQETATTNLAVAVPCQLTISKMSVKLNFAKPNADSASLKVDNLDLGAGFDPSSKVVLVDIGGTTNVAFTLDAKGKGLGVSSFGRCKLHYNKNTQQWALTAKLIKGSWQDVWASLGLLNANIPKPGLPVELTTIVAVDDEAFAADKSLGYTAKVSKSGTAK